MMYLDECQHDPACGQCASCALREALMELAHLRLADNCGTIDKDCRLPRGLCRKCQWVTNHAIATHLFVLGTQIMEAVQDDKSTIKLRENWINTGKLLLGELWDQ